jgi:hypothetical protein
MATYDPPTETLPIFDPNVFTRSETGLTTTAGDLRYLRFPYAQGSENLQQIDVYGVATFNTTLNTDDNIVMTGTPGTNYIQFPNGTKQYTAGGATSSKIATYLSRAQLNTQGTPAPYPTISFLQPTGQNYNAQDGCVFRVNIIVQTNTPSINGTMDSVSNFCNTFSATMTIFPDTFANFGFRPTLYFNNGVNTTSNVPAYAPVNNTTNPALTAGRLFWSSQIVNDGNVVSCLLPSYSLTSTPAGFVSSMILDFPAINWGTTTTMNYYMTFELLNAGIWGVNNISTTNFDINITP